MQQPIAMSNLPPLVAVLTPFGVESASVLTETIRSVQAQTYPHLLHLLAHNANDARFDPAERARLSETVPILTVASAEAASPVSLWNLALASAPRSAVYLRLLRAGDTLAPTAVAEAVAALEQHGDVGLLLQNHARPEPTEPPAVLEAEPDPDAPPPPRGAFAWPLGLTLLDGADFVARFFRRQLDFSPSHLTLRAQALEHRTEFFDPDLPSGRFEGVLAAALSAGRVGLLEEPLGACGPRPAGEPASARYQDFMIALHRHGPSVFAPKAFRSLAGRYRRHYLRNTLSWRFRYGAAAAAPHFATLAEHGGAPTTLTVADAMLDGALVWAGFRPEWR